MDRFYRRATAIDRCRRACKKKTAKKIAVATKITKNTQGKSRDPDDVLFRASFVLYVFFVATPTPNSFF